MDAVLQAAPIVFGNLGRISAGSAPLQPHGGCADAVSVAFGINRTFTDCTRCGHAQAAHIGGCFCGCLRFERSPEAPPPGDSPVERLLAFMYEHLSRQEVDAVIAALAQSKGVPRPGALHDRRQGFIIENFTRHETERFLKEFRRRQRHGQPLVRSDRIASR